ncbi:MAG TPA: ester cyclase [Ktedonobacteraceae bacterium]|jgi:steroid delta-isomerase-like uncharacterized protein
MSTSSQRVRQKAVLRQLYTKALQGDLAIIDRVFASTFVDHSSPDQAPGPAGVRAYFYAVRRAFPDIRVVLDHVIAEEDYIVLRTTWQGTHLGSYEGIPATGQRVSRTLIQIFRMARGLILEEWNEGPGLLDALRRPPEGG